MTTLAFKISQRSPC